MPIAWWLVACAAPDGAAPTADRTVPAPDTGADTAPAAPCDAPLAVDLGWGASAYAPLGHGDAVWIVHGFQSLNAFHIDIAGRVTGAGPGVRVAVTLTRLDTGEVVASPEAPGGVGDLLLQPVDACDGDFFGFRALFDPSLSWVNAPGICALDGAPFRIDLTITDLDAGAVARDRADVIVTPMPFDPDADGWVYDCDNCPVDPNPDQADADGDGIGDACAS